MIYVGCDLDANGALAVLNLSDSPHMDVAHLPKEIITRTTGTRRAYLEGDGLSRLCLEVVSLSPRVIMLEEQQAFDGDGAHAMFTHGFNVGRMHGSLSTAVMAAGKKEEVRIETIRPVEWKGHFGLIFPSLAYKDKKKKCVEFASTLFPHHAHLWAKVKDTSLAEAALIALFTALSDGTKLPSIKGVSRPTTLIHHKVMLPDLQ